MPKLTKTQQRRLLLAASAKLAKVCSHGNRLKHGLSPNDINELFKLSNRLEKLSLKLK